MKESVIYQDILLGGAAKGIAKATLKQRIRLR